MKRQSILDAALVEFSARGFHGARIERIAASAPANKQLIFHYFGSKEGLYEAAVANIISTAPDLAVDASLPPPDAIRHNVQQLAVWLDMNPRAAVTLSECLSGLDVPAGAAEAARFWMAGVAAAIRNTLEEGQRKGFFRDDLDHHSVIELIVAAAIGKSLLAIDRSPGRTGALLDPILGRVIADYCGWR